MGWSAGNTLFAVARGERRMDILVNKTDLRDVRIAEADLGPLSDGEAELALDHFALTANNITYAAFGDAMNYWAFFPAAEPGWGRVPVWGFADVVAANGSGLREGDRVYGYFPMSTRLRVRPDRISEQGFVDAAPHRQPLAAVYNRYRFTAADPNLAREHESLFEVLNPLFVTGWLFADFLDEADHSGATQVVLSSASSKTAIGLAHSLKNLDRRPGRVVGLTSPRNRDFVAGLGLYDATVAYDALEQELGADPAVYVDFAGDAALRKRIHEHFGAALRHSGVIGASHWEAQAANAREALPGPPPTFFFAPSQLKKRIEDWGAAGFDARSRAAWGAFCDHAAGWLQIRRSVGGDGAVATYREVLEGGTPPNIGHVVAFSDDA